jgi:hypothetical protein
MKFLTCSKSEHILKRGSHHRTLPFVNLEAPRTKGPGSFSTDAVSFEFEYKLRGYFALLSFIMMVV